MKKLLILFLVTATIFMPEFALASSNVSEFTAPLEKFSDILGGPWIKIILILAIVICMASVVLTRGKLDELITQLLIIIVCGAGVLAAGSLVTNFFGFSGAVIG